MFFLEEFFQKKIESLPELAKEQTNSSKYRTRAAFYRLKKYADGFLEGKKDIRLVIMYGLRGIGKTVMLMQLYSHLIEKVDKKNMIYLSADQLTLHNSDGSIKSVVYQAVSDYVRTIHKKEIESVEEKLFVFIDEAHFDKQWDTAVKTIYDSTKNIFLIVTGSSAISLNISTDTARRAIKEPIFPISFLEYNIIKSNISPPRGTAEILKSAILSLDKDSIAALPNIQKKIATEFRLKGRSPHSEVENFLRIGAFGFSFQSTEEIVFRRILDMVDRIIKQDMPYVANFDTNTFPDMLRIVGALANKKPGETSHNKLFNSLNLSSPTLVKSILDAMEKTQLLIQIKPFPKSDASKSGYPFKYYFISSTILTSLKFASGKTGQESSEKALIWETAVADVLFKITKTSGITLSLLYDTSKGGNVDFLILNPVSGQVIPIEVGLNKGELQIRKAIEDYKANFGIVISDIDDIKLNENVLYLPFWLFLYTA